VRSLKINLCFRMNLSLVTSVPTNNGFLNALLGGGARIGKSQTS